jgi:DNA processing protein
MIKDDPRIPWLVFLNIPATGPVQHKKLLEIYKTPENIISAPRAELAQAGLKKEALEYLKKPPYDMLEGSIGWLQETNHHFVTIHDSRYPALLKEIPDAPAALFVAGDPDVLNTQQIGIVGSRNPTAGGRRTAESFAAQLAEIGFTITSGLALGIDYCSHAGALEANGKTVAVLGNGPDIIYPARHKEIAATIAANRGAIVSEFPPGVPPIPANFPRRNRIISGLSVGVLVVEAATRSGSLITARCALDQGREVFAVPGSVYNPLAKGCHHLIKQGARLVENIMDILEELNIVLTPVERNPDTESMSVNAVDLDTELLELLEHIPYDPVSVDKLIESSGLTADAVSSMLLVLEVQGIVSSSGGLYTRINQRK